MLILHSPWSNLGVLLVMAVSVQVPASTTNLGPGFDCLGISLQLWNRIRIEVDRSEGPAPEMVSQAADLFFNHTGETRFAVQVLN